MYLVIDIPVAMKGLSFSFGLAIKKPFETDLN